MRPDIEFFPPPREAGQLLGHDGTLTSEEVQHLESLGYVVAHYKAFTGSQLVQAYFEGLAKGLIELDGKTFRSMDTIRKQLAKMTSAEGDFKAKDRSGKPDIVTLLRSGMGETVEEPQKRRRGRPAGS